MEFLLDQAKRQGSPEFVIPYDRQALADYLGVERSWSEADLPGQEIVLEDYTGLTSSLAENKINKLDLPTIFHKEGLIDKFAQYTLPARYFGDIVVKGTAVTSDGVSYRSLVEQDVTLAEDYTFKGKTIASGQKLHLFAGDLIPNKIALASASAVLVPSYKENSNIILKIVHKDAVPYMSSFEAGTSFFNPRSLTENHYLTFGHNTITALHDKPFITLKVSNQ